MAHATSGLQGGAAPSPLSAAAPLSPKSRFQVGLQGTTGFVVSESIAFSSDNTAAPKSGSAQEPAENPRRAVSHSTIEYKNDPALQSFSPQDARPDGANVSMPDNLPVPKSSLYSDLCPKVPLPNEDSIPGTGSNVIPSQNSRTDPSVDSLLMPPPDCTSTVPSTGTFSVPYPVLVSGIGSLSSLGPGIPPPRSAKPQALDTLSYLDSVSMMSGTMESLTFAGLGDDASSMGSDSEINGVTFRKTDKYGFMEGNQNYGGESAIPVEVARQRELKWLEMFRHWDKWVQQRFQKVKLRCRKGIPSSLRARAWQYLSNSYDLLQKNPGKFEELDRQQGDPKWLDIIEKDLHRQFPFHEMFAARGGHGQQDLYRILKAYTIYKPDEGYCQAQAPVAAVLLMHMPAEQAFWCLVQICDKYLPGYYSAGLEAIQLDGEIFFALLRRFSSIAYRHLKRYKIDPILYMTEWFMCIFSRTLPWSSVLRIWDMFFCEGVKIVFRVGLVLLRSTLGAREKLRDCQGMYETMEKLRNIPVQYMQEEYLAQEVINLPVTEALIERESGIQRKKWEESRGELQHKPSRRLYGCRAVNEEKHRMNPPLSSSGSFLSITSLKRFKDDKKDKSRMLRDQKIFIPVPLVASIEEHPLSYSPVNPSTNSVPKPTKEERREDVEPDRHEQKKDRAEKDVGNPSASVIKTSHEPPELTVQVVSEGLRPSLPSPTANITPLGEPKKNKDDKRKEKELEKQRAREMKEKEKQLKLEKEKEQKEREKQLKLEKEKDKKIQKEKKEEAKLKKEKRSKQKDQPETTESSKDKPSQKGEAKADGVNGTKGCAEKVPATTLAQKSTDAQNVNSPSSNVSSAGELQATFL